VQVSTISRRRWDRRRQIVEKMGGQVQARGLEHGSEFSFTLPAAD
jgi:signal transduction histidine kinase